MNSFYTLSYIVFITTMVILTFVLFFVDPIGKYYKRIVLKVKYYALTVTALEVLNQTMVITYNEHLQIYKLYDCLITPLIFSIQLFLINSIILTLFFSKKKVINTYFTYHIIGLLCILSLYLFGVDIQLVSNMVYISLFAWIFYSMFIIIKEKKRYFLLLENLFSGNTVGLGKYIASIMHPVYLYFLVILLDFILYQTSYSPFMIIYSLIITAFVIKLLNVQNVYLCLKMNDSFQIDKKEPLVENYSTSVNERINDVNTEILKDKILMWVCSDDKPYLNEGITLSSVADEIKVSPLKLSFYLNNLLNINFNVWINKLRIDEAKNLINNNNNLSLAEISVMVGFSEPATFSKTFKKITGLTPSDYKKTQSTDV